MGVQKTNGVDPTGKPHPSAPTNGRRGIHTRWAHITKDRAKGNTKNKEKGKYHKPTPNPGPFSEKVRDNDIIDTFLNKILEPLAEEPPCVVNLSDYHLSNSELTLLEKGLNFCPTPGEPDMGQLRRDLDIFHRNLRIKNFFTPKGDNLTVNLTKTGSSQNTHNNSGGSDFDTLVNKSSVLRPGKEWTPPMGPLHLESFILTNERDLNKTFPKAPKFHNITRDEKKGIKTLASDRDIVIKPADKGGAIVILKKEDYIAEGEKQLSDGNFYKKLTSDKTESNNKHIEGFIQALHNKGEITKNLERKLRTTDPKTPELYLLPKIHKPQRPPPGRPVVSANNCPTEKISALTDIFLKPHLPKIKSYIKDTTDFIQKLNDLPQLSDEAILCTLDVSSLYTNIPNTEGRAAVTKFLRKHRTLGKGPQPSNKSIIEMLNMVLTMNSFKFNGEHFLQTAGTAMGTRVAPTYANIFMSDFEDRFVYSYPKQPMFWGRFIDDIFLIWEHGQEELEIFLRHLNTVHKTIKFTSEYSHTKVNFLDVWAIKNQDGHITTNLYTKPTDSNSYLHFYSAHPSHCKKGIPLGQFLRLRRICSKDEDFIYHSVEKSKHFLRRGYPKEIIRQAFRKAWEKRREDLLKKSDRKGDKEETNILVTTYSPGFGALKDLVHGNWDILGRSCSTRGLYERGMLTAYRRPKNLKDLLVRAKLPQTTREPTGNPCNPCTTKNCRYCPKLNKTGRIKCKASGREYVAKHNITCKSSNIIYCISCKCCGIQYVGQTKNRLMDRFQAHFYNIAYNRPKSEIGKHFNSTNHKGLDDVEIYILDFIHAHPMGERAKHLRDLIEFNWIQRLHTNAPLGLNTMDLLVHNSGT